MRNAFAKEITRLAQEDERIVLLSGDIGNRLFDELRAAAPKRFYNCGVAEANMIGVAAGLAMCGLRPVCYTITPFLTYRVMEQIRVDLCYHRQPVLLVGTGSGLAYASLGPTHHSCEEMGMLRILPEMQVFVPADAEELRAILRYCLQAEGPTYMRIGKKGEPVVHSQEIEKWKAGQSFLLREGKEIAILACGTILPEALRAAELLTEKGRNVAVWSCPSVKPLDKKLLEEVVERFKLVVTVEEHSRMGGFGGAVAEWMSDWNGRKPRLVRIGTPNDFYHKIGDQALARNQMGIDAENIAKKIELCNDR